MNVFILDRDPKIAASYYCDKHMKIIIEIAQMLNTNSILLGGGSYKRDYKPFTNYKLAYPNHPCTKWIRSSLGNTLWVIEHGLALTEEFKFRYGHDHKSKKAIEWVKNYGKLPINDNNGDIKFVQCMPEEYKCSDTVEAYRTYYLKDKAHIASWKRRGPPEWWTQ